MAEKIGEFRKKLRIVDIMAGPDEGLGRVGQTLVVMGWVRTLRVQSSVTFIEVTVICVIVSLYVWFSCGGSVWFPRKSRERNGTKHLNEVVKCSQLDLDTLSSVLEVYSAN